MVDAIDRAIDFEGFDDVLLDEGVFRVALEVRDVLRLAGQQVVDADDVMALRETKVGQM